MTLRIYFAKSCALFFLIHAANLPIILLNQSVHSLWKTGNYHIHLFTGGLNDDRSFGLSAFCSDANRLLVSTLRAAYRGFYRFRHCARLPSS